ncbi:NPCBM/NEW2 domain-containing protein [Nakamurella sp. PAMC28650]|uniref:NPCBM/NEW2 domain-containing protein n=1 Tax=Nakamurella sp. PAMC28650 TaxID=2762325 RepID=UPI00164D557A|nr:NPCBM/NEW2 domain-containing protein [Nakamurella sp. PAMC28650]QNK79441.1 NPCBM/NEW2 domain-containing protein [Nakamurella sp. PAMC28650]
MTRFFRTLGASAAVAILTVGLAGTATAATPATPAAAGPAVSIGAANGLLRTPPMGFNDWNSFGCNVDEQLIKQTADYFVSSGLKSAGYRYVNIDDCWMSKTRDAAGHLVADPVKFPDGIKGTADYVHSKGLELGIYESAGTETCAHFPGSLGHETTDANDFAAWGVDYLKYDNCGTDAGNASTQAQYVARYTAMGKALAGSGRKIAYSLCEWGQYSPWTWADQVGNLWRTTGDISDNWASLKSIIAQNAPLSAYAKPGAWNDPDMLEVGNGGMTDTEYRTHFALWAEMAAPLLIGTDLRRATPATMSILLNKDIIAVDQDRLGVQGQVIAADATSMVFSKPLANGNRAIALYNSGDTARSISTSTALAGLPRTAAYQIKDLWTGTSTETAGAITASVPAHGTVMLRVSTRADNWAALAPSTSLSLTVATGDSSQSAVVLAGHSYPASSSIINNGKAPLADVRVTADAADGWTISTTGGNEKMALSTGRSLTTGWTLTAPAGAATGNYRVSVTASYLWGPHAKLVTVTTAIDVTVESPPPAGTSDVSALTWDSATNGWGPVEKNTSNGENAAGDGRPITINGTVFTKGLGVNAPSTITYYLGGNCSTLTTAVGIDDEVGLKGSAIFQIYADNGKVADSGVLTGADPARTLTADLTGATWLKLVVDDNGSADHNHADWAGPRLTCGG